MKNTLFYAEREFQARARLAERAATQEWMLQSLSASNAGRTGPALVSRMAAGTRSLLRSLRQAALEAGRSSIESSTPQEQCC